MCGARRRRVRGSRKCSAFAGVKVSEPDREGEPLTLEKYLFEKGEKRVLVKRKDLTVDSRHGRACPGHPDKEGTASLSGMPGTSLGMTELG